MPVLFMYLLKLSLSLAVVYIFYQLVLRRLTFYTWNRWYLAGYSALCFFIPFIDISIVLERNDWNSSEVLNWVPMVEQSRTLITGEPSGAGMNGWEITMLVIGAGMLVLLLKLLVQFLALQRMKRKALPVEHGGLRIYQVNDNIMPFSFGNSIFINRALHEDAELHDIIRHEFIHVKQKHSFDIIWSELFCIINWYNPFAWLIKRSIRQNLEFIADSKVVESGIPKKEYQYLLLKVIGNNQYSIATAFNYSSLKKRIAMMNKLRSTRTQLLRMLFLLPATAILLLAFRNGIIETPGSENLLLVPPSTSSFNEATGKPVQNQPLKEQSPGKLLADTLPKQRSTAALPSGSEDVESMTLKSDVVSVKMKSGETVVYNLALAPEKEAFEKKYGKLISLTEAVVVTGSPAKHVEGNTVTFSGGTLAKIPLTKPVTVAGQPLTEIAITQPVTVAGQPLETLSSTQPVIVAGHPLKLNASKVTLGKLATTQPAIAALEPIELIPTVVEVSATPGKKAGREKPDFLNLGGLTTVNEGQYILVDGREPQISNGTIKGTFRITFLDKNEGVKKYGQKGTNGVILLETIKHL